MRVVIVENNVQNLNILTDIIKTLEPNAKVKGFVNGNEAIEWCNENAFCVDLFIGNWWGVDEEYNSPEGANVFNLVKWFKKPKKILVTIRIHGAEADIHTGADTATIETVLQFLRSC